MEKDNSVKTNSVLIIVLVLLISALGFFGYKALVKDNKVLVPDFSNSTQSEVQTWCESLETNPCSFTTDYSETIEKDKVIYQSITPDAELGESISFIISLGKKISIQVPTIDKNTTKESIKEWANKNNLTNISYIDETSETIEKGTIIRIEPNIIESLDTAVHVYVSSGKKPSSSIHVDYEKYIDLSVADFETKAKALGLTPKYAAEKDDFSETIAKGKIVWHGSGEYTKDEEIRYGISKGKRADTIVVTKGSYVGYTLDAFTSAVSKLGSKGLKPTHKEDYDEYSSTIAKGLIVYNGYGDYENEENISYGLSLGEKSGETIISYGTWLFKSVDNITSGAKALGLDVNHKTEKDEYSDIVEKGLIIWHGSGSYAKDGKINYGLSLGSESNKDTNTDIVVKQGDYVGKTYAEFEKAVKELGLVPNHRAEWDVKDSSKSANTIARNGYGTYIKGENISYGLYVGAESSQDGNIVIEASQFVGKTFEEFKTKVEALGLKPEHSTIYTDDPSDTIPAGCIDWHGAGTYEKGEVIHYSLSTGPEKSISVDVPSFAGKSETDFKNFLSTNGLKVGSKQTQCSDTVASGLLISNDTGSKAQGALINYIVSAGKDTSINVTNYAGKSESELTSFLSNNGLTGKKSEANSSSVAAGIIISNDTGKYETGETVNYTISIGAAPVYLNNKGFYNDNFGVNCHSFDEMKTKMQAQLSGFTNVTYSEIESYDRDPGMIEKITIDGSETYEPGNKDANSAIVVYIVKTRKAS